MSSNIRLNKNDLNVGMLLPSSVYDSSGLLLLKKGTTIASERQIESLIKRGLYRHKADGEDVTNENENSKPFEDERTPFEIIYDFAHRLTQILSNIELAKENSPTQVKKLCTQLQQFCTQDGVNHDYSHHD